MSSRLGELVEHREHLLVAIRNTTNQIEELHLQLGKYKTLKARVEREMAQIRKENGRK